MAEACLSEGELEDVYSGDEKNKRKREEGEGGEDEWQIVVNGAKRKKGSDKGENKQKKKKRNRSSLPTYSDMAALEGHAASAASSNNQVGQYLNGNQRDLLMLLSGEKDHTHGTLSDFKTHDLRKVICYLTLGFPELSKKSKKLVKCEMLQKKKIVIIWLSCVSREMYLNEKYFHQLKQLSSPSLTFGITHPGSDRFVHFGLDAFMTVDDGNTSSTCAVSSPAAIQGTFDKLSCCLSYEQLVQNEYNLPSASLDDPFGDDGYNRLVEVWPVEASFLHSDIRSFPMYAVDCEMVTTTEGSELASVCVINEQMEAIYHTLVKPVNPVIDYLTKYSGVDENKLRDVTVTLSDVQIKLKELLPSQCILIGHSLENDLIALKLYHPYVIDTSLLFTPYATPKSKPSLKLLSRKLLEKEIQMNEGGHDPREDAMTCMELVKKKLMEGSKCIIQWNEHKTWLPSHLSTANAATGLSVSVIDKYSIANLYTSDSKAECHVITDDGQVPDKIKEVSPYSRFIFAQLHSLEHQMKNNPTPAGEDNALSLLDDLVYKCVESSSCDSIILAVCGSSYIKDVRELQKIVNVDVSKTNELTKAVMKAREGIVAAVIK
jgi:RNA exonuclease 1